MKKSFIFLFPLVCFLVSSCNRDRLDPPEDCETEVTYTADVKSIIDNSCAYAGCHINGAAPGDFSSYEGLEVFKEGDEFRRRTLEIMNMPPNYAPADRPKSLTEEELELINCWVQNDYKE